MKPSTLFLLFSLVLPVFSARALDPSIFDDDAPLTPALTQLFTDLEAIPADATVTDAQHAALVADLLAQPPGPSVPDAAETDQLATDLGSAASAGLIDDDEEYNLASEFDVDPTDTDSWFNYVRDDVTDLLLPPDETDPDPTTSPISTDPINTYYPLETLTGSVFAPPRPSVVYTSTSFDLSPHYYQIAGEVSTDYHGSAQLTDVSRAGAPPVTTLKVQTGGLPLAQSYRVYLVRASDRATFNVGKFHARGSGDIVDSFNSTFPGPSIRVSSSASTFGGELRQSTLSVGLLNLKTFAVLDPAGRARFTHEFAPKAIPTEYTRRARLPLQTGAARGVAIAKFKQHVGFPVANELRLSAKRLPANATLTLLADGTPVGQYTTTAQGRLVVSAGYVRHDIEPGPLPSDLDFSKTTTVSLTDAQGTVLLTGGL